MGLNSQYCFSMQRVLAKKVEEAMFLNLDSIQLLSLESHLFFTSPSCIADFIGHVCDSISANLRPVIPHFLKVDSLG